MKHTYLLEEGKWCAVGTYIDEHGSLLQAEGETVTTHQPNIWIHDGTMALLLDQPVKFSNRYEINPFQENATCTTWTSHNPALGKLLGTFVIVTDTILSYYHSECGQFHGIESLMQIDEQTYHNRGTLLHREKRMSSWAMDIHRIS